MANFNAVILRILDAEGGYVNDPLDAGGETNFGISKRAYPDLDIANLTIEQAKEIYKRDYWDKIFGDWLITNDVAEQIMDMAVNAGVKMATLLAQELVDVIRDGVFGEMTLNALNATDQIRFVDLYKLRRIKYYLAVCKTKPDNKKFLYGWIKRVVD